MKLIKKNIYIISINVEESENPLIKLELQKGILYKYKNKNE
jgi:hypothetical protein